MYHFKHLFSGGCSPSTGSDDKMGHHDIGCFVCGGDGRHGYYDGGLLVREPRQGGRLR